MSTLPQRKFLTPEEYLEIERKAEFKSEYFNGEMFAMAGASRPHNRIATNVSRILDTQLLTRDCNVYSSDMRVKIEKIGKYTYQDAIRVEQYVRQSDHTWMYSEYQNLDDIVKLESVNCKLTIKDIYAKVSTLSAPIPEN